MKKTLTLLLGLCMPFGVFHARNLTDSLMYKIEMQSTNADGKTPLWLNANKYGLSSLNQSNGYMRMAAERSIRNDSTRRWGFGYGLDMAATYNFTSSIVVQQAFAEARWLHGTLTIGSKEYPMELKNQKLSSGSQTFGINARPVPQIRIAIPDYWTVPLTRGWLHLKGHVAYGKMTDDNWQHSFTNKKTKYADDVLYHSKAGYLKIGKDDSKHPLSVELGLEMAAEFGGTIYRPADNGGMEAFHSGTGLGDYWRAFIPGGAEVNETTYQNIEGNQVGSWLMRINYETDGWKLGLYADHYFEDQSSMFMLDYNGYGTGEDWNKKKDNKFFLYDLKDMMLGAELNLKKGTWIRDIVFEYLYTKYQSGPVYHDRTPSISDHIGGIDNYYNHSLYPGWQHWGQVMGNPLYLSPIYNEDGKVEVENNRLWAFHLGIDGLLSKNVSYRILTSYQKGFGTYYSPYIHSKQNISMMAEASYHIDCKKVRGLCIKGAFGTDIGELMGHNYGIQFTISKNGWLNF
jgi:hypothetical protein